jgi:hypothetical protein
MGFLLVASMKEIFYWASYNIGNQQKHNCARFLESLAAEMLHEYDHLQNVFRNVVGFEVLTAASTKMAAFWVVAPCSLVEVYQRFRGPCCFHHQGLSP